MGGCIFNTLVASSVHGLVVIMFLERQLHRERERLKKRGGGGEESMWSRCILPHLMVWDTIDFILFGCENRISEMERVHFIIKIIYKI